MSEQSVWIIAGLIDKGRARDCFERLAGKALWSDLPVGQLVHEVCSF